MKKKLGDAAAAFLIELPDGAAEQFETYLNELTDWNSRMNLTALHEPEDIVIKHFIDSLSVLGCCTIPRNAKLADIGSGAGFPGVPLKIARPDIHLCCLDSMQKRVDFLK